ncbi:hypothetical protein EVD20_05625 [Elizabethkingia bruuniana]|nr:hypothetical protein [Elizabethkingia bruuniana]QDZ62390.1 hypothetical protein EVD20_05625 [Elizabethkingia bruuniana]
MNYTENIERLKILLTGASTDVTITSDNEAEYKRLKSELNKSAKFQTNQPKEFKICFTLQEFRREMQAKGGYAERRKYINEIFYPLISDENSLLDSIEEIQQSVNFGHLNLCRKTYSKKDEKCRKSIYIYIVLKIL